MIKVLFVCLGNICRSPSAEAVMIDYVKKAGLSDKIFCDSAGTNGRHDGENADPRSREHALKRGYDLTSISRKIVPGKDFADFNYIVVMDDNNLQTLKNLDPENKWRDKMYRMVQFCQKHDCKKVPDPYHMGPDGFEDVLDILEDACSGFLQKIKADHAL